MAHFANYLDLQLLPLPDSSPCCIPGGLPWQANSGTRAICRKTHRGSHRGADIVLSLTTGVRSTMIALRSHRTIWLPSRTLGRDALGICICTSDLWPARLWDIEYGFSLFDLYFDLFRLMCNPSAVDMFCCISGTDCCLQSVFVSHLSCIKHQGTR